ncbi:hypothetical protein [Flavobacterium aquidurense]|uniref:Uncharacterized protein n=1 Tax=Flavobacterium aquidurense TaxID=362413 RepID=A0A0Q0RXN7_9FLAO|nr:hypothetical protein [Flavobacterium aquidurense]KQB37103.1 hypothetical protein RC62_2269 [Flavobacterium aquidurense]
MIFFELSDIISIIEICVNIALAFFLANFIQKNQVNSRTLKDYYIREMTNVHSELLKFLDDLDSNQINPQDVENCFFRLVANTNNLILCIEERYKLDSHTITQNILDLQSQIENDINFQTHYRANQGTNLTNNTINDIRTFRVNKLKTFHDLNNSINDYSKSLF